MTENKSWIVNLNQEAAMPFEPDLDWEDDEDFDRPLVELPATGSLDAGMAEQIIFELNCLAQQRGLEELDAKTGLVQEIIVSGKRARSFLKMSQLTPFQQAQFTMYEAFESNGRKRVKQARRALSTCPDCADAYILLANEEADDIQETITLFEQGVQAGERALKALKGDDFFEKNDFEDELWSVIEAHSYLRARLGLSMALWDSGRHDEAVSHWQEMLRLTQSDPQGVRYVMLSRLLDANRNDEAQKLLSRYENDITAAWAYARVLLELRAGNEAAARRAFEQAMHTNRFVPFFLFGPEKIQEEPPEYFVVGEKSEAVDYVAHNAGAWFDDLIISRWLLKEFLDALVKNAEDTGVDASGLKKVIRDMEDAGKFTTDISE